MTNNNDHDHGWADGGWAVQITEYPDEGLMGPYATDEEARAAAAENLPEDDTTIVKLTQRDCLELGAADDDLVSRASFGLALIRTRIAEMREAGVPKSYGPMLALVTKNPAAITRIVATFDLSFLDDVDALLAIAKRHSPIMGTET